MKRKTLYSGILLFVGVIILLSPKISSSLEPQSEDAKQTMVLGDQAATLLQSKGTEAFTEFRKKDSKWLKDDTYIFVVDMNGIQLLHPVLPKLEGKSVINVKDANGKTQVREMIEIAKINGSGWVEYMWPKPGESEPSKKMTYIMKVNVGDKTLIVGSGFYTDCLALVIPPVAIKLYSGIYGLTS